MNLPNNSVSHSFKVAMVVLLFLLTFAKIILILYFPDAEIIPDMALLITVFVIVSYLWIQELKDYHHLLTLNEKLVIAQERLKEAEIDTIAALIKAEEEKDLYTRGHSERVTRIALAIAGELKFSDKEKKMISRAGILHDIGKIGISDSILGKKDKLTEKEWDEIKKHPQNAVDILRPLKFLLVESDIILSHHERYDGGGYPRGHKGPDIHKAALILAVADAFDAMNSKRPYRDPLTKDAIIAELNNARGAQHDPEIIDVFLALLKKKPEFWEK